MKPGLYIGPLIERSGKFSYETFSLTEGLRSSFGYPRVEEARYDRQAMVAEAASGQHSHVHVCETLAEFEQLIEAVRDAGETPAKCNQTARNGVQTLTDLPNAKAIGP
jgi:hypothetical protein